MNTRLFIFFALLGCLNFIHANADTTITAETTITTDSDDTNDTNETIECTPTETNTATDSTDNDDDDNNDADNDDSDNNDDDVDTTATTTATTKNDEGEGEGGDSFEKMTNEELEAVCTSRGFELVREKNEDGKDRVFTRDNYIDAATQCLEIESEMEQILKDHPQLLDEIEAEADRMRKENKTLQEQLAKAQQELEEVKQKEGQKFKAAFINDDDGNDNGDGNDNDNDNGNGNEKDDGVKGDSATSGEKVSVDDVVDDDDDDEVIDLDDEEPKESSSKTTSETSNDTSSNDTSSNKEPQLAIGQEDENEIKLITVKDLFLEFRDQIQKDFTTISNIVFPVAYREPTKEFLKPIISVVKDYTKTTYSMMKRYVSIFIKDLGGNNDEESTIRNVQNALDTAKE